MGFMDAEVQALQDAMDALVSKAEAQFSDLTTKLNTANTQIAADQAEEAGETSAPSAEIVDPVMQFDDLHLRTDWVKRVGPGIGGKTPAKYDWSHVPNPVPAASSVAGTVMQLDIAGGSYSDWLDALSVHCVLPQKKMRVVFAYKLLCDSRAAAAAQAIETDSKIIIASPDGTTNLYDLSFQCFYPKGGMLQLWNPDTQSWFDSGIAVGKFTAMQWRHVQIEYEIDPVSKQYRYISYLLDGTRYDLRSSPMRTAKPSTWTAGFVMQLQQDENGSGQSYTLWIDHAGYEVYLV